MADDYKAAAEFYDGPYRQRGDVQFFVDQAADAGGTVLEVGCGTGRVLIPAARAGVEILGLDASPAMLSICRNKLELESEQVRARVQLHEGDMRSFDLGRKFGLVMIPFRPFQHLISVEDQLACLSCIHRHLEPGGKLIFDLFNPSVRFLSDDSILGKEIGNEPEFVTPDGRRVLRRDCIVSRDLARQVQEIELAYHVTHLDGRRERIADRFPMRYCFRYEVEHLLKLAGFEVQSLYADYDKSPFGSKYPGELIFVAVRSSS